MVGRRQQFQPVRTRTEAFDNGRELHVSAADVFEEVIHLKRETHVIVVQYRKRIKLDLVVMQPLDAPHDPGKRTPSSTILTIAVVHGFRPIDGDADQKIVVFEETAPFVVKQQPVCLDAILYLPSLSVLPLEFQRFAVEVEAS